MKLIFLLFLLTANASETTLAECIEQVIEEDGDHDLVVATQWCEENVINKPQ